MSNDKIALINFVLEQAPAAPVHRRIPIYRGLADLCGDAEEARTLNSLAENLQLIEQRAQEFAFRFDQKNSR
jgi:hypothetical protein